MDLRADNANIELKVMVLKVRSLALKLIGDKICCMLLKLAVPIKHCNDKPIYLFPEKQLRDLLPNFHIHVSVSDINIPMIGPYIFLQQNRQTERGNIWTGSYLSLPSKTVAA